MTHSDVLVLAFYLPANRNTSSAEFGDQLSTLLLTMGLLAYTQRTHVWPLPLPHEGELSRMPQQEQNVGFAWL